MIALITAETIDAARERVAEQLRPFRPTRRSLRRLRALLAWELACALRGDAPDATRHVHQIDALEHVLGTEPN